MKTFAILIVAAAAFAGGYGYGRWYGKPAGKGERKVLYWVDPMHPWYKSDKPGIAPDCNMALEPVYEGEAGKYEQQAGSMPPGTVQITPEKQQLIGVQFGAPEYTASAETIRAVARVSLDETRIAKVQSRIEGWVDDVFVDFTGKYVKKGEPLLAIYSPDALATQNELLLAVKARDLMHDSPIHGLAGSSENLLAAARRRLALWDIGEREIDRVVKTGKPLRNLTLNSPISGFVMERNAFLKQRVAADTVLYTIADLSRVWVMADVYEYEAPRVRLGQTAVFTMPYMAGKTFRGTVSYILPQVDPESRTIKVRIELDNPDNILKQDMYGDVELRTGGARRLTVPQSAVLNSGERQIVFVDRGSGHFEPREVRLGLRSGDRVEILQGLSPEDRIVVSGNFLIDSESQLQSAMGGGK